MSNDKHQRPFGGRIGETVADSAPHWPNPTEEANRGGQPNILLVVFDDTGWSDFGCFGSEIATPHIDALAQRGLRYSNFHVTPLCSPTRACLLTGRNHHAIGMRFLSDVDTGFPNSRGFIRSDVRTLPQRLQPEGFGTFMVGKWHLAPRHEMTPAGPFHNWPLGKGFEKFYGFLDGATDQYAPELVQDNQPIELAPEEGYHLSADLADRAIRFIADQQSFGSGRPFFLQLAFGATHAPFQAPRETIAPYIPIFEKGWDQTRIDRLERQKSLGLVPSDTMMTERNTGVPAWSSLTAQERLLYTHLQAAYAGFLTHADQQLGRLLSALERMGISDDTVVIVMSDNGASREGGKDGAVDVNGPYSGRRETVEEQLKRLDQIGGPLGPAHYPEGWAMVGNTPFRRYKQLVDLGGVRSPLVVSWPRGISTPGEVRNQFVHAIDIAPTVLSLVGQPMEPDLDGRDFSHTFAQPQAASPRGVQYWEMMGHRAIWHEGWKAVTEHVMGQSLEEDKWRLYDTRVDFSEAHDLSQSHPEIVKRLARLWWEQARTNDVLPIDDRSLVELIRLRTPLSSHNRQAIVLRPDQSIVPFSTRLTGTDRSFVIHVDLCNRADLDEGVLVASGSIGGGYVLYIRDNRLCFEHVCLGQRVRCIGERAAPLGASAVGLRLQRAQDGHEGSAELWQDGEVVGSVTIPYTSSHLSFFGLSVCRDATSQVGTAYEGTFDYPQTGVEKIRIEFLDAASAVAAAAVISKSE